MSKSKLFLDEPAVIDEPEILRGMFVNAARAECRARITAIYNARNVEQELFKRLRGDSTEDQDGQRDAILNRYREIMASDLPYTTRFEPSMFDV